MTNRPIDQRVAQIHLSVSPKFTKADAQFALTCILMVVSTAYAVALWIAP